MSKGHARERQVRKHLEDGGWWVCRSAGSLGDCDIVAATPMLNDGGGSHLRLIEIKANAGSPYMHFGPADRKRLAEAAELAGGVAALAHWPPRGKLRWYYESDWP